MFRRSAAGTLLLSCVSAALSAQSVPASAVPASRLAHLRHGINLSEWFA